MKFTTAYYLMLLYSSVMLSPVIPLIKDVVSHSFAEAYHMSVIHARFGAHHAEDEMANSGAENDAGKNQTTTKSEQQVPVHLVPLAYTINITSTLIKVTNPNFKTYNLPSVFISRFIPPPRFS